MYEPACRARDVYCDGGISKSGQAMSDSSETIDAASIIGEVERFYRHYIDTFNDGDLQAHGECFDDTGVMLKRDLFNVLRAGPELQAHAHALRKRFLDSDWIRTEILASRVWLIEPDMAMVVADLGRVTRSDAEYERARCVYLVVRRQGRWKIRSTTVSIHALPTSDGLLTGA